MLILLIEKNLAFSSLPTFSELPKVFTIFRGLDKSILFIVFTLNLFSIII